MVKYLSFHNASLHLKILVTVNGKGDSVTHPLFMNLWVHSFQNISELENCWSSWFFGGSKSKSCSCIWVFGDQMKPWVLSSGYFKNLTTGFHVQKKTQWLSGRLFVFLQKTSQPCLCIKTGYLIYLRTMIILELQALRTTLIPSMGFGAVFNTRSAVEDTHLLIFSSQCWVW